MDLTPALRARDPPMKRMMTNICCKTTCPGPLISVIIVFYQGVPVMTEIKGPPENFFVIFPAVTKKMEEEIVCNRW